MVLVNTTSWCELSDYTALCVSDCWHDCIMFSIYQAPTKDHSLTAQGCCAFAVDLHTQRSGKLVIQSRSPCTFTLFSLTCFSSSTWWAGRQMRDHSLSPGVYTQVAPHAHTHTRTHLKVVEYDAWLWRYEGTDRNFDCSYPSCTLHLLFDSVPLNMCKYVCVTVYISAHMYMHLY